MVSVVPSRIRRLRSVVWLVVSLVVSAASAQTAATAEALFDEARRLMDAGDYAQACPKFAESQRLDPAPGTLLNLAECYERAGKTASAWATWLEAAAAAKTKGQADREALARDRAAALQDQLLHMTIVVPDSSRIAGLAVQSNGAAVREVLWGTSMPVDPGTYIVSATAPGKRPWQTQVTVQPGQEAPTVVIPPLQAEAAAPVPTTPPPAPITTAAPPTWSPAPATPSTWSPTPTPAPAVAVPPGPAAEAPRPGAVQRTFGYVLTGVGVVGLGIGTYFSIAAVSKNKDSKDECRPEDPNLCTKDGVALRDDARSAGTGATVGITIGVLGLASGILLLATAPSGSEAPPQTARIDLSIGRTGGSFTLRGGF
jgi:hypothetical protein